MAQQRGSEHRNQGMMENPPADFPELKNIHLFGSADGFLNLGCPISRACPHAGWVSGRTGAEGQQGERIPPVTAVIFPV